ncbi:penicillin acylase family protein [Flavitalea flava]
MYAIKSLLSVCFLWALVWGLNSRFGIVPPLGKLLSPSTGIWQNMEREDISKQETLTMQDLNSAVVIKYDSSQIPHIFADNDHDLYFAQGYATAKDRLWQMDMQVRTASGTLSEIMGSRTVNRDIFIRRIGLLYAAERALDSVNRDGQTKRMLEAYTEGVNAYIRGLSPDKVPVEFKIFDYKPVEWKPINCLLVLKLMGERLSGGQPEFGMTNALNQFGPDTIRQLFHNVYSHEEPVVPGKTAWNFSPLPFPDTSGTTLYTAKGRIAMPHKTEIPGSNNWAVDGSKTANGYPLLANDPHLELTLPSVWYQVQLQGPGINVYGVSVPGIPSVMIGFNNNIAWGLTNTTADVVDWYYTKFKDNSRTEYLYDGKWNKVEKRVEQFRVNKGGIIYDTILYTCQGPVVYDGTTHKINNFNTGLSPSEGRAMRWTLHDISNDLKTFYLLNRAKNYADYRQALQYFNCPAQNFVYAGTDCTIAITCNGKLPIRYKTQGEFVLDGRKTADDWHGWIPMDQLPYSKNPARGFVSSANQSLTDSTYPYYIGGQFASFARARRINERLSGMTRIDVDSFSVLQNDSYSEFAADILPFLLNHLDSTKLKTYQQILSEIFTWNYKFEKTSMGATLFNLWWNEIYSSIWSTNINKKNIQCPWPDYERTAGLLQKDSNSLWIRAVCQVSDKNLTNFVTLCFQKAIDGLGISHGNIGEGWKWGYCRPGFISHMGGVPSFGIGPFSADGAANTINALSDRYGPSWRMVVELGPVVKGYGILPGGQSGNPGSYFYDNLFSSWKEGKLKRLVFFNPGERGEDQVFSTLLLKK